MSTKVHNKLKIINDPVHGFIRLPHELIFDVMEHPYFQRLRRIGQTGLLHLIFPGATHTRFHHALGAMHLMFTALETLKMKGIAVSDDEEMAALLAILLHDIGHGPYSHALESMLLTDMPHEQLSRRLMAELNDHFDGRLTLAIEMFDNRYSRKFFHQLISSQLDVDRLDYLKRDSFYTGVAEGNVNTQRIISMLNVIGDELVVDEKGIYSIENYLTSRMFMYWQVYFHKTSVVAEQLLVEVLKRARTLTGEGVSLPASENLAYFLRRQPGDFTSEDMARFTTLDDTDIMQAMKIWADFPDTILQYFCRCIVHRKFPKVKISDEAASPKELGRLRDLAVQYFDHSAAGDLVFCMERHVKAYDQAHHPIKMLTRKNDVIELPESGAQLITAALSSQHTRYILAYPREITSLM